MAQTLETRPKFRVHFAWCQFPPKGRNREQNRLSKVNFAGTCPRHGGDDVILPEANESLIEFPPGSISPMVRSGQC